MTGYTKRHRSEFNSMENHHEHSDFTGLPLKFKSPGKAIFPATIFLSEALCFFNYSILFCPIVHDQKKKAFFSAKLVP